MAEYHIVHKTEYEYDGVVNQCHNEFHLRPRESERQRVIDFSLVVEPEAALTDKRSDYYGNPVHYISVEENHRTFRVISSTYVDVKTTNPEHIHTPDVQEVRRLIQSATGEDYLVVKEWTMDSPLVQLSQNLAEYGKHLLEDRMPFYDSLVALTERIYNDFQYLSGVTHARTSAQEAFLAKQGVCQDFAHVAVGVLRSLGFPCRYVSGYIETIPPPGQKKLVGADATHAWFSAWIPGSGWFDFDPTNNKPAEGGYITTAWGRDYSDVTPIKGVIFGGGSHSVDVSVDVNQVE